MAPSNAATLKPRVIGLTGNIACGKSTVARLLAAQGLPVIDADQVSREVSKPGTPALEKIVQAFGAKVLAADGSLDRQALRTLVFADPEKRKVLESILHPAIRGYSQKLFAEFFRQGKKVIIYEASLLFEAGRHRDFDGILVVTCDPEVQKRRLLERDPGASPEVVEGIIAAQMPQAEKAAQATWVIENNGTLEELTASVRSWLSQLVPAGRT